MAFVNYHKHTMWTNVRQSDSSTFVEEYIERIKQLQQNVLSTVEHGWQGNVINYYELAKANNLKLLIGAEAYWVKDRKEKDSTNCHICLLAKNEKGRRALNKALTIANVEGYYYKPRLDVETILSLPKDDIWCTTACIACYKYGFEYTEEFFIQLHNHFGNNFYLEVQTHNVDSQKEVNQHILEWSKEYNIEYICGLDSHYIYPEDAKKRNAYIESRGIRYPEEEQFILDFPDEKTIFDRFMLQGVLSENESEKAIKNTYVFENVEEYTGECFTKEIKMPVAPKYKNMTMEQREKELRNIVYTGFNKYSKDFDEQKKQSYIDEIERNLSVIHEINHADYFLGNYEFIKRGKELGCMLSPTGRGSAVSFLVNFFLEFTKVDKMQSAIPLYAERFLSAKRVLEAKSLADIDHNSGYPDKLQQAMEEVYGKGHCYPLIAYGTMKNKGAWKMYARVNNIDFEIANKISEQIDQYELDLKHASEDEKENIDIQDYISPEYYDIYKESTGYLKLVNSLSVHPCANLLYTEDIIEEFGLILVKSDSNKKETLCVCADGAWIENYKFLKADLLKVDVSKLIYRLYDRIGGDVISIEDLLMLSEKHDAWDIYARGITMGINQVEQEGSKNKVMRYKPRNIAELAAFVAAVRPGFKSLYKRFEERDGMSYGVEHIDNLLKSSNGMILYQENVMAILNYAGYDMSDCYTILKAIAKKKPEVLQKRKIEFHDMMVDKLVNIEHIDSKTAEEITVNIWQVIDDCSSYSFNSCLAGDTIIQKSTTGKYKLLSIEEMYNVKNSREYAVNTGHRSLYDKFKREGYGNGLSLKEDNRIYPNEIVDIRYSGIAKIYRIILENGYHIDCTMNHKFPTIEGDKYLSDLKIGDELFVKGEYEKSKINHTYTDGNFKKNFPKKGQCGFQKIPDGNSVIFHKYYDYCKENKLSCEICGKEYDGIKRFELHHKDLDSTNNCEENFQWLCVSCHKKEHYRQGRRKRYEKGIPSYLCKIKSIEFLREDKVYDVEMKHPYHNFVVNEGIVTSNSHAMCVALDGLYCALIKKTYPLLFYEVYLNLLEENEDKDKIVLAKEEATKFFNISFPKPKFGDDNRKSIADTKNNSIITSLKSIKGFSSTTANELYKLGAIFKHKKANFYDILKEIEDKKLKINTSHIEKLIAIGYFSEYGSISSLVKFYACYQKIHGRKEFKTSNEDKLPIKIEILRNFCNSQTTKTLKEFNEEAFFNFLLQKLSILQDNIKDIIFYENEYLGQIYTKDENAPDNLYYVQEMIFKKTIRSVLYHIKDGTRTMVKIRKKVFDENPFTYNELIKVYEINKEPRYVYQGEDENKKPKFTKDYENLENILKNYYVLE